MVYKCECGFEGIYKNTHKCCFACGKKFGKNLAASKTKTVSTSGTYHVPSNYQNWHVSRKPWYESKMSKEEWLKKCEKARAWVVESPVEEFKEQPKPFAGAIYSRKTKSWQ